MSSTPQPVDRVAYSVPEAAEALGIGTTSMWKLIWDGRIAVVHVGRRTIVSRVAIDEFLAGEAR